MSYKPSDCLLAPSRTILRSSLPIAVRGFCAALVLAFAAAGATAQTGGAYKVANIISSDSTVPATTIDPNFINPWGISVSGTWWIAANGTGYDYVVPATGAVSFKVIVPPASGTATGLPTGSVTTAGASGMVLPNGTKASFLFSSLDGVITGWNSKLGTANAVSQVAINNSAAGAVYTGLATFTNAAGASFLLAPNFGGSGAVEVYDQTFKPARLAGSFSDPNLPANYVPYSIHVLNGQVYVAYTPKLTTAPFTENVGVGNGLLDIFDLTGNFVTRAVTGGNLNAPWGVAFAPANFGIYSKALLIGNFGDGKINAFDPKTFAYLGKLNDTTGHPLSYASMWDLLTGGTPNAAGTFSGGDTSTVYFSAGLAGEAHGLFAGITNDPAPTGTATFAFTTAGTGMTVSAGAAGTIPVSLAPVNNFSGPVTIACFGLPQGSTCAFSASPFNVVATAPTTGILTIQTAAVKAQVDSMPRGLHSTTSLGVITFASCLPLLSLLSMAGFRKRLSVRARQSLGGMALMLLMLGGTLTLAGCSSASSVAPTGTPNGTFPVTMVATSGTTTQQVVVTLNVK